MIMAEVTLKVRSSYFQFPEMLWESGETNNEEVTQQQPNNEEGDSDNGNESHHRST